jgi:hypothetical protein
MNCGVSRRFPSDVRYLLLIEDPQAQHDDSEQCEKHQRGHEHELGKRLAALTGGSELSHQ